MKTCGLKHITIGGKKIPAGAVSAALRTASRATGLKRQIAKSFSELPFEPSDYVAYEKWFMQQVQTLEGRDATVGDITRNQEYTKEEKDVAKELVELLKPKRGISPATRKTLKAIAKTLKENQAGLTPAQLSKVYQQVSAILAREDAANALKQGLKRAKDNISKGKLGANFRFDASKLLLVNPLSLTDKQFNTYRQIIGVLGANESELSIPSGFATKLDTFMAELSDANLTEVSEKSSPSAAEMTEKQKLEAAAYKAQILREKVGHEHLQDRSEQDLVTALNGLMASDLEGLSLSELRNLSKSKENVSNGFGPSHQTQKIITKINSQRAVKGIAPVVEKANSHWLLNAYQRNLGKALALTKDKKNWILEVFRSNPLSNIDSLIGSKGRDIVEGIFNKVAAAFDKFSLTHKALAENASKAEDVLVKESLGNRKRIVKSKFKVYIYQLVREYESNKGKGLDGVNNPYAEVIQTIEDSNGNLTHYGPDEAALMQELVDEFSSNGRFDSKAMLDSMTKGEKEVLDITDGMYASAAEPARFATRVIHGEKSPIYENYVYKNRINKEGAGLNDISEQDFLNGKNSFRNNLIAVKSGSTKARTNNTGSLKMDPIDNAYRASKNIHMDYYMSPVIKETRLTADELSKMFRESHTGEFPALVAEAIEAALDEGLKNVFSAATHIPTVTDKVFNTLVNNGYRMVLSSLPRAVAEMGTNLVFVMTTAPTEFTKGATDYFNIATDNSSVDIWTNVGSTMGSKLFEKGSLSGKFAESDILGSKVKTQDRVGNARVTQVMNYLYRKSGVKMTKDAVGAISDFLISSPDKAIGRPLWLGVFSKHFKEAVGSEVDYNKIKANDKAYMDKHADAISEARARADEYATLAGAATNPFTTVLKLQQTGANKASFSGILKTINSYMARFLFFEQATFMKGLNALVGRHYLTPAQGASLMAATVLRMGLYNATRLALISMMFGKSEDDEDFGDRVTKDLVGSLASLVVNRNLVTIPKVFTNFGIEKINEEYLDFLRDGKKYDPYRDSIVFSQLGERDFGYGKSGTDFLAKLSGKYSPLFKSGNKAWQKAGKIFKAKGKKRDRMIEEFFSEVSIDAAALSGMLPLYRDLMIYMKRKEKKK